MQLTAQEREDRAAGSSERSRGIGGGPSGFLSVRLVTPMSTFALATTMGLPVFVSRAPVAIHERIRSSCFCGSLSPLGGMMGSTERTCTLKSRLASASPALITGPLLLPARAD